MGVKVKVMERLAYQGKIYKKTGKVRQKTGKIRHWIQDERLRQDKKIVLEICKKEKATLIVVSLTD